MRKFILTMIAALMAASAFAQGDDVPADVRAKLMNNMKNGGSTLGTHFVLGFPPNEREVGFPVQDLAIFIGAPEETEVTLSNTTGDIITVTVPKQDVALFSTVGAMYPLSWAYENWINERPVRDKAIIVRAKKPVSVYVMNSKVTSSEGYLAIPVDSWGKEYIHCAYYDFREGYTWGSGFQVLASEDNTNITINLRGQGGGIGETTGGKTIGDQIRVTLDAGEIYQIQGDGETRGIFDLSGSLIRSNKPVGVISYHNRVMIPKQIVSNGRDNLLAMMPPVHAWGKKYVSVEMDRGTGKGDYFRVVAAEDDTDVKFAWYTDGDPTRGKVQDVNLQSGDVWSPYDVDGDLSINPPLYGVNGVMIIEASKPILVMQYAYSERWDQSNGNFDPFMFPVTAVEQFTYATLFQSPKNYSGDNEFHTNHFNLLWVGDTNAGRNQQLAQSIILDGSPLTAWDATAGLKKIPFTDPPICYVKLQVEQGVHRIYGDTPFGGYLYGFARNDSYAWPAATNYLNLAEVDPWPPVVEYEDECDIFYFDVTDNKPEILYGDTLTHIDLGMNQRAEIMNAVNFKVADEDIVAVDKETRKEVEYLPGLLVNEYSWRYQVDDPYQDAELWLRWHDAYLYPSDSTFTDTIVYYIADKISFTDEDDLNFEQVRVDTEKKTDFNIRIENEDLATFTGIEPSGIYLKRGVEFTLDPVEIDPQSADIPLTINYQPTMEFVDLPDNQRYENEPYRFDFDTLVIETECLVWEYELRGQGVLPQLIARDFRAGVTQPGVELVYRNNNSDEYRMVNNGTMETFVTAIAEVYEVDGNDQRTSANLIAAPITDWADLNTLLEGFELTPAPGTQLSTIRIDPRNIDEGTIYPYNTGTLKFQTNQTGDFRYEIVFEHTASDKNLKENVFWTATVTTSELKNTDLVYPLVRVNSYNAENTLPVDIVDENGAVIGQEDMFGMIRLTNTGDADLAITGVTITGDPEGNFMFDTGLGAGGVDSWNRWKDTRSSTKPESGTNLNYSQVNFETIMGSSVNTVDYILEAGETNSLMVPMIYNPKSVTVAGIEHTAQIQIFGKTDGTTDDAVIIGSASVSGTAFLPEITVDGYDFQDKVTLNTRSTEEDGVITITNDGDHELTIFGFEDGDNGIFKGAHAGDFSLADFTAPARYDLDVYAEYFQNGNIVIPVGASVQMPVAFYPVDAVGNRTATFDVLSDATASQDDPNNRSDFDNDDVIEDNTRPAQGGQNPASTEGTVTGVAFTSASDGQLAIGATTTGCDVLVGGMQLINTDPTSDITLLPNVDFNPIVTVNNGVNIAPIDWVGQGIITVSEYDASQPLVVGTKPFEEVVVTFDPTQLPEWIYDGANFVDITFTYEIPYEYEGTNETLEGVFPMNSQTVRVTRTGVLFDITDNTVQPAAPGQESDIVITAISDDWATADLTTMTVVLNYNSNMFFMDDEKAFNDNNLPNGWVYDDPISTGGTVEDPIRRVTITAKSNNGTAWPADADFFRPGFVFLIHDDWGAQGQSEADDLFLDGIDNTDVSFHDRGGCVAGEVDPGFASTDYCSPENMNVVPVDANAANAMASISPNPVTTDVFTLDYQVRISGGVQVKLVDMKGQVVAIPFSGLQNDGSYSIDIPTDELGSGVYQLILNSPGYTATQPVNIVK